MTEAQLVDAAPGERLTGRRILYASTNHGWDYGWTFFQMLAEALARENDVVYLDSPTSAARLPLRRWGEFVLARAEPAGALRVLRTAGLPAQRSWRRRFTTGKIAAQATARWAARAGFAPNLVWTYAPWELPVIERFAEARSVYWAGDHAGLIRGERALLERVDAILAVADPVYEELSILFGDRVHPVTVACDFDRYHSALVQDACVPPSLGQLGRPIFGYAGWVSQRVDFELLRELASRTTGTVVVAGVLSGLSEEELHAAVGPDVVLLGAQSRDELPALIRSFDVGLVPYLENEFNRHSNPAKFYEYLATGRPTVTTDIPTLRKFASTASVGARATFVERALAEAAEPTGTAERRVSVGRAHSFDALLRRLGPLLS